VNKGAASAGQARFVGREREFAALVHALGDAPAVVLIEGEAGIGKSRLLREFLTGQPARTLVAECPPVRQPYTLGAVVDAARQAEPPAGLTCLAGALRPLFPEWSAALPPALEPLADPQATRHQLFRALVELLARLDVTVLVIEDVHWADEATLDFLLFMAGQQPQPVSLVLTYRPDDVPEGSQLLRLTSRATRARLALAPLDVAETASVVSSMLDDEPLSDAFARFVHEHTDGVPLAIEETVRLMRERADVTFRNGRWARKPMRDIHVAPTIRDAVLERAARLGPEARGVLDAVAVIAEPSDDATLAAVTMLPPAAVTDGLTESVTSGLLTDHGRGATFRHALAARAVYEAIPSPRRRALHLRAGQALETVTPQPVARLARHFREAGEVASWCRHAEQAADLALASGDTGTGISLLYDLITSAGLDAESMARLTTKIPFGSFTGDDRYQGVISALTGVLDAEEAEPAVETRVRYVLGIVYYAMSAYDAGRAEFEAAIPHLPSGSVEVARAMALLGHPRDETTPQAVHRQWLRRAVAVPVSCPTDRLRFHVDLMTALLMLGDEDGWEIAAELPQDASSYPELSQVTRGALNAGDAGIYWGRYAEADSQLRRGLGLARAHDLTRIETKILATRAHLHWFTGEWDGLAEQADSLAASDDMVPVERAEAVLVRGLLYLAAGDSAAAGECLRRVLADADRHGMAETQMTPAAALARMHLSDGRPGEALAVTDGPFAILVRKEVWLWASDLAPARADALVAVGRAGEAAALAAAFAAGLGTIKAPAPQVAVLACQAIAAEGGGDHETAARLFGRVAAGWQALPRPYDVLLARERQAGCLLKANRREQALSLLADVLRGLSELGAPGDADRVARRLREHGVAVSRVWRGGPHGYGDQLSPRELEVVRLVATGRTNREIAAAVHRSPDTVAAQLKSAMRKLGVSSRTALAVYVAKAGLTSGQPPQTRAH
jgi:DNA-binding CsgD family transcriptional regulator/tetratricopeptide (TPR) repeat protein